MQLTQPSTTYCGDLRQFADVAQERNLLPAASNGRRVKLPAYKAGHLE